MFVRLESNYLEWNWANHSSNILPRKIKMSGKLQSSRWVDGSKVCFADSLLLSETCDNHVGIHKISWMLNWQALISSLDDLLVKPSVAKNQFLFYYSSKKLFNWVSNSDWTITGGWEMFAIIPVRLNFNFQNLKKLKSLAMRLKMTQPYIRGGQIKLDISQPWSFFYMCLDCVYLSIIVSIPVADNFKLPINAVNQQVFVAFFKAMM
jgi:hypothetical protein